MSDTGSDAGSEAGTYTGNRTGARFPTRRAAVLGAPIAHSLSPLLYRAGFAAAGLTGWSFDAVECAADDLAGLVGGLGEEWAGLAVTMPGKAAAAAVASERSDRVALLGVANTLVRLPDGRWRAENTDVDGVLGVLFGAGEPGSLPVGEGEPGSLPGGAGEPGPSRVAAEIRSDEDGSVLLLGGGGTALAVLAALGERDWTAPVLIAGRDPRSTGKAVDLAGRLGLDAVHLDLTPDGVRAGAARAALVVSTLPAGVGDPFAALLAAVPMLFDVIYRPWPTALAAAGRPGRVTVTGLDMLAHQAFAQFPLITGMPAPREAMWTALAAAG